MPRPPTSVAARAASQERRPSAQIIMFSHQFYENQELAATAAEKGCLPVYKTYDDACARNLLVTVKWAANRVSAQTGGSRS